MPVFPCATTDFSSKTHRRQPNLSGQFSVIADEYTIPETLYGTGGPSVKHLRRFRNTPGRRVKFRYPFDEMSSGRCFTGRPGAVVASWSFPASLRLALVKGPGVKARPSGRPRSGVGLDAGPVRRILSRLAGTTVRCGVCADLTLQFWSDRDTAAVGGPNQVVRISEQAAETCNPTWYLEPSVTNRRSG